MGYSKEERGSGGVEMSKKKVLEGDAWSRSLVWEIYLGWQRRVEVVARK
jgi:hypothetical protein